MDRHELAKIVIEAEGLSNDVKSELLNYIRSHKKFGLVWEDKPEEVEQTMVDALPVLTEVKENAIISEAKDSPNHIIIEGDNLQVLTTLAYTHAGKIDVIYIDPPYNTGENDFAYNDRYIDKNDEYRHSKWLSFMEKRLKIAKQLLSPKGVIFISIDDNEQAYLKVLCDEIFGTNNFLGHIIWQSATDNNPRQISTEHEYVVSYAKQLSNQEKWLINSAKAQLIENKYNSLRKTTSNIDVIEKELRKWIKANKLILKGVEHYNNVDERGVYSSSSNSSNTKPGGYTFDIIHPISQLPCSKPAYGWRWTEETFLNYAKNGDVEWGADETTQPHIKKRIDTVNEQLKSIYYEDGRASTKMLENIFGGKRIFNNPKPILLIRRLEEFASRKNSIILDFFAGSGTTLHATMDLNNSDKGKRQCILVQVPETTFELKGDIIKAKKGCEVAYSLGYKHIAQVTYERNKRVINGYTTPKGEVVVGLKNNNLRYYKTDFVPAEKTNANKRTLVAAATDMLCIKNDIFTEQELFAGRKLKKNAARYFDDGKKQMLIIYNELAVEAFAEQIREHFSSENKLLVYVFSVNSYAYTDSFEEVLDKMELCALPDAIYKAYKSVIKPKRKFSEQAESIVEGFSELENEEMSNNEAE